MCILLNVKKHEKTFALNVDIFIIISHRRNRLTDYAGGGRMKEIHGIEVA